MVAWWIPMAASIAYSQLSKKRGGGKKTSAEDRLAMAEGRERGITGRREREAGASRNRYLDFLETGDEKLMEYLETVDREALPQFKGAIQELQENNIRRGVTQGGLPTSYEGDTANAFHQNIMDTAGRAKLDMYGMQERGYGDVYGMDVGREEASQNRYLDLLAGNADREVLKKNAKRGFWGDLIGSGLQAGATYLGSRSGGK